MNRSRSNFQIAVIARKENPERIGAVRAGEHERLIGFNCDFRQSQPDADVRLVLRKSEFPVINSVGDSLRAVRNRLAGSIPGVSSAREMKIFKTLNRRVRFDEGFKSVLVRTKQQILLRKRPVEHHGAARLLHRHVKNT